MPTRIFCSDWSGAVEMVDPAEGHEKEVAWIMLKEGKSWNGLPPSPSC